MQIKSHILALILLVVGSCQQQNSSAIVHFDQVGQVVASYFDQVNDIIRIMKLQISEPTPENLGTLQSRYNNTINLTGSKIDDLIKLDTFETSDLIIMSQNVIHELDYTVRTDLKWAIDEISNSNNPEVITGYMSRVMNNLIALNYSYQLAQLDFAENFNFDIDQSFNLEDYSQYVSLEDSTLNLYDYFLKANVHVTYRKNGHQVRKIIGRNDTLFYKKELYTNSLGVDIVDDYYAGATRIIEPVKDTYEVGDSVRFGFQILFTDYHLLIEDCQQTDSISRNMSLFEEQEYCELYKRSFDTTIILQNKGATKYCLTLAEIKEFGKDSAVMGFHGRLVMNFEFKVE